MSANAAPYRFHAFDVSYFSAKVRPALRYKQVWYEERRANYREILRRTGIAFIPILVTPEDETWQDSTDIYERLEERHPDPPLFPSTPAQLIAAHLVELYVDEFGTIPAMHYRWGHELAARTTRARFVAMTGNAEVGNASADRMAAARVALGATDETGPANEAHTRELWDALGAHFEEQPYLLGARMSFGDCALMGQQYGHFFVDLVSRRLMLETAVPVVGWVERCNSPNADEQGEWLPDDALAPGLRNVLEVMGRDAVPVILACLRAVDAWADAPPDDLERIPRAVGSCETALRGVPFERMAMPYTSWNVGRVLDVYRALDPDGRKRVDEAIAGTGWEDLLAYEPRHRFTKRGFALAFE